ncbi:MAG TPA: Ppx/GppA family phosphatase [Stellaceae bacterium]|jgi:exopolyphosphatase/guanosine-5'-triphosphate,3'-diphosphate pyrophosphatase
MPDRSAALETGRIGIIDLGSNSLRLAVFERQGAALFPLLNEKVMCGLARGLSASGRLNRDGMAQAVVNLRRFVALARAIGVDHLAVLATAAVRDASDGQIFADDVARQCRVPVTIVDGAEEARLSAAGVLAGIPEAEGIVGDLGGGSVELIRIGPAVAGAGAVPRIGRGITLPLGPLRLAELGDNARAVSDAVERALAAAPVARAGAGQTLYLVGGASRAIARLHMEHTHYPLHIVHGYTVARAEAEGFFDIIGRLSRKSLERIRTISKKRLEMVPLAALILRRLIAVAGPRQVTFSAYGLREGYAHGLIPEAERNSDPLIAAAVALARTESRFAPNGDRLQEWTAPLFPDLPERSRRLHRAACWLADIAWIEHPDYRAEQAFTRALRMPLAALAHPDRVFVAAVLHTRYGGSADDPARDATRPLLDPQAAAEVRTLGLALRLAYTMCGGVIELLSDTRLGREGNNLILEVPAADSRFGGETVQRRLDAVARSLGIAAQLRHREPRRLADD